MVLHPDLQSRQDCFIYYRTWRSVRILQTGHIPGSMSCCMKTALWQVGSLEIFLGIRARNAWRQMDRSGVWTFFPEFCWLLVNGTCGNPEYFSNLIRRIKILKCVPWLILGWRLGKALEHFCFSIKDGNWRRK